MSEKRGGPSSGRTKSKPKRPPGRSTSGNWWPYAIVGGVVVLVAAFVAITQLGHPSSGGTSGSGGGLALGAPLPPHSVPSSDGGPGALPGFPRLKGIFFFYYKCALE